MSITQKAAGFVSGLRYQDIPARGIEAARIGIADCLGCLIAGAKEPAVEIIHEMVPTSAGNEGAPAIPFGRSLSAADAALVNGVAAHVLDFDDVAIAGHPSAVLAPAILAEGWALDSPGEAVLTAYAAGYELWAQLMLVEPGHLHDRGFHPTAVLGTLATAAACARLRGLDTEQTRHAIAIGASLASGIVANFGSMTKSLHAGRAAQAGVLAARLAEKGYTASADALEHEVGFLASHSPSGAPDLTGAALHFGTDWLLEEMGVCVKRYPTCYATHRSIDAMVSLVERHGLAPAEVAEIHVHTGRTQALMLRNAHPVTGLEAKFSMQFAMAAALVAGKVGLGELTDDFVQREDVADLFAKVRITTTDEIMEGDQPFAPADLVTVITRDGRQLQADPVVYAKGNWQRPLTRDELAAKFLDCGSRMIPQDQAERLFDQLWTLDRLASVRDLSLVTSSARG